MKTTHLRGIVAATGTLAMAVGTAATLGTGAASAESSSITWIEKVALSKYSFERTVSNTTPSVGDEVTVTTRFYNPPVDWYINSVKDIHNSCLTYLPGSATFNGKPAPKVQVEAVDPGAPELGYVLASSLPDNKVPMSSGSRTFSATYTVGASCAREVALPTTVHYATSLISTNDANRGPAITVAADPVTPDTGPGDGSGAIIVPGAGSLGGLNSGSLGSIFGSIGR